MLAKVIATYTGRGGFEGFEITPDNGRLLNAGEVRFTYVKSQAEHIKALLQRVKADYKADLRQLDKDRKKNAVAREYTQRMRALRKSYELTLRDANLMRGLGI